MTTAHRTSILSPLAAAGWLVAALVPLEFANAAEDVPRRLPALENSTTAAPLATSPAYAGPPAIIDGPPPERLPPADPAPSGMPQLEPSLSPEIAPGIGPEELQPFEGSPLGPGLTEEELLFATPQKINPYKSGFFQKLSLSAAWIGNGNDPDNLGITEIETFLTVALPAPIKEWPVLITPGYNMYLLSGPGVTDLPPRLNTAYLDVMWLPKPFSRTTLVLAVAPSVFSDFESNDADMFRLTGKALVLYDWFPDKLQFVFGLLYLNRDNVRILPAGGAIWTPNDDFRFELIFPKPKLGARVNVGLGYEDWVYGTAEFGGNTWSIVRDTGLQDQVTYIDYRILGGYERKLNGGAGYRLEAGYVFGRSITFQSGIGDFDPQSSFILRGGLTY
ncbi:MAG: hypothetical protein SFU86_00700 [Pirellulaceae bacterium]|nr:hypothetical protein [Pirellulaceae bacterium]